MEPVESNPKGLHVPHVEYVEVIVLAFRIALAASGLVQGVHRLDDFEVACESTTLRCRNWRLMSASFSFPDNRGIAPAR